jgi:hypothetical protein
MKFTKDTSHAVCFAYKSICGRFQILKDSDETEHGQGWSLWDLEDGEWIADAKTKRELVATAERMSA